MSDSSLVVISRIKTVYRSKPPPTKIINSENSDQVECCTETNNQEYNTISNTKYDNLTFNFNYDKGTDV